MSLEHIQKALSSQSWVVFIEWWITEQGKKIEFNSKE
jgi:hypothetical protein